MTHLVYTSFWRVYPFGQQSEYTCICIVTHFQHHVLDHQVTVKVRNCVAVLMLIDETNFISIRFTIWTTLGMWKDKLFSDKCRQT